MVRYMSPLMISQQLMCLRLLQETKQTWWCRCLLRIGQSFVSVPTRLMMMFRPNTDMKTIGYGMKPRSTHRHIW